MGTGDGTVPVWSQWKKITTDNTIADYPFDHGSNSNGEWWKYESGRLVQRISLNADNASPPSKWEAMFTRYFGNSDWTFPIPFVGAPPAVIASCQGAQFGYDNISLTRVWGIYQMRPVNYGFTGGWKTVIAEGRWK